MYKTLIVDRCHFSRCGLESWLRQVDLFASAVSVTSLSSLLSAKEHIEMWQPHVIIADLCGFTTELQQLPWLVSILSHAWPRARLILFQEHLPAGEEMHDNAWAQLNKNIALGDLANVIDAAFRSSPGANHHRIVTPLLTRQEEKVLSLWMEGTNHNTIARLMNINGKTVYTYKRNIRLKLKMENRFSPFLAVTDKAG